MEKRPKVADGFGGLAPRGTFGPTRAGLYGVYILETSTVNCNLQPFYVWITF